MTSVGVALFDTALGRCGIAWTETSIVGVQLPEAPGAGRARLLQRFPDAVESAPPPRVQRAAAGIAALLRGEAPDLDWIELDMSAVAEFDRRGTTRTYGEIAAQIGDPGAARAVGQALGRNPFPVIVPCHRVLAAAGRPGGFSASGGVATKLRMLAIEGAPGNAEFDF
jgi:methylated-DNA-[protein]-cysteine S-methyltransferase